MRTITTTAVDYGHHVENLSDHAHIWTTGEMLHDRLYRHHCRCWNGNAFCDAT